MPERKSGRSRKSVDYAKFGGDDTDDDDFRDATPPVAKKPKISNKENEEKIDKKQMNRKEPKARRTVEEKMFERELQAALELSMSQSDPSQESEPKPVAASTQATDCPPPPNIVDDEEDDRAPSPILPPIDDHPPVLPKVVLIESDIEVLEENIKEIPSKRGRTAKPKKYVDSDSESGEGDSDFAPEADSDVSDVVSDEGSDDDFNEDDSDSDFGCSKKKKDKKAPAKTPKQANAKVPPKTSKVNTAKPVKPAGPPRAPVSKPTKPTPARTGVKPQLSNKSPAVPASRPSVTSPSLSSPTARGPALGLTKKTPNWTPPAASGNTKSLGGGTSLRSPSTGLRIGLSRNMKLKPLHPKVKVINS